MSRPTTTSSRALAALTYVVGPALVLDDALRIEAVAGDVEELLGFPVPLGASAPKILCGSRLQRPVAEALAAGRAARAFVPRGGDEGSFLDVRANPLPGGGHLVTLAPAAISVVEGPVEFHGMVTQSAAMKEVFRIIEKVAVRDFTILVRGETGTGKELVAAAIHQLSKRRKGPFRALNCAALPPNLLESELFGHARGAFTGAVKDVQGHVELADGGTLFLDEVAELPLELQAKLLRVIETRTVLPVGGRKAIPVDVRIVSATHRSLRKEVEQGRFRADLMYRLRVIPIFLPPLRERPGDISLLAERFVAEFSKDGEVGGGVAGIRPEALEALEKYPFEGNIRELRNVLQYAAALGDNPWIRREDLPAEVREGGASPTSWVSPERSVSPSTGARSAESAAETRIRQALVHAGGSRERAAKILGISRVTLWRKMKDLGLATDSTAEIAKGQSL